jgi:hypothetical protein
MILRTKHVHRCMEILFSHEIMCMFNFNSCIMHKYYSNSKMHAPAWERVHIPNWAKGAQLWLNESRKGLAQIFLIVIQGFYSKDFENEKNTEEIPVWVANRWRLCKNLEIFPGNWAKLWLHESRKGLAQIFLIVFRAFTLRILKMKKILKKFLSELRINGDFAKISKYFLVIGLSSDFTKVGKVWLRYFWLFSGLLL